ncbi:MAG: hypothetical protein JWQ71_2398 [Pedosphaera sp.]|nr:hypothetical protein [Pedosphaera sp.]
MLLECWLMRLQTIRIGKLSMKPRTILFGCLGCLLIYYFALANRYYVIENLDNPQILWSDKEAFIFIGAESSAQTGSFLKLILQSWANMMGIMPDKLHEDLYVFHFDGERSEKFYLPDFGHGGQGFIFEGGVYFIRGTQPPQEWPLMWKWTGTNFYHLPHEPALKIANQFKYISERLKLEGWQETTSGSFDGVHKYPFTLHNQSMNLVLEGGGEKTRTLKAFVEGFPKAGSSEQLLEAAAYYRRVSKSEFTNIKLRRMK